MLQIFVSFGNKKPKNIFSYLAPTLKDLLTLQTKGMKVKTYDGQEFFCKAFVLAVVGDFPAMSELLAHKTHASEYGCRICLVKGIKTAGRQGFSFIGENQNIAIRQKKNFDVDEVSYRILKALAFCKLHFTYIKIQDTQGIKRSTPLKYLACFHDSSFCCLDELHLWGHHAAKQLWQLITTKEDIALGTRNILSLKPQHRKYIVEAMLEAEKRKQGGTFEGQFTGNVFVFTSKMIKYFA